MNNLALRFTLPVLFLLLLALPTGGLAELTETEVTESLICYACPGEPLSIDRCSGGDRMREAIRSMLAEGKNKQQILDYFVAQFGDSILTTVPKRGFNLVAYLGPIVGLLIGIPVAILVIRRWGSAGQRQTTEKPAGTETVLDDKMKQQIETELARLDEED
ncbi:cytochrome c-type biogenesis protein [Geothermobacter hydrogeniphilus]|uniref:Cytochrome c-type biogenesis protein n=1 Tax=Geothermobacter hydrogeniphilus TaxID=1969733 RepID=A0A1X0Y679_9BACT|nr:cytochrome c-type biogenesis protein CcmH [Geothermobacter hydrogeniphilus]ORJ60592.1 hypothetical protein B5V00_07075 [Geothermobacter hydrogeniphilus]